jgi:hypothetical protein
MKWRVAGSASLPFASWSVLSVTDAMAGLLTSRLLAYSP